VPCPAPAAFLLWPCAWIAATPASGLWQQEVYRRALAEAQAVVRPSILERGLAGAWN
jgi:hypothetical protein